VQRGTAHIATCSMSIFAAWIAIAASGAAAALLISLHVLSPEFSPAWRMISEYANGQYGWVLSLMFIAYGLSILALAVAIRSHFNTRRQNLYPGLALLVLSGIGAASAAQFDLNQAVLHELAGVVGILCLPIAAMLISPSLAATAPCDHARTLMLLTANLTWVSVLCWFVSFGLMIVTFVHALGGLPATPPEEVPAGVIAVVGWTNRLMVLSAWCWVSIVAWHVITVQSTAREVLQGAYRGSVIGKETVGA
jgi:hypothetical protein